MSNMSCFSSLLANSWAVPGEELTNTVDFLSWISLVWLSEVEDQLPPLPHSSSEDLDDPTAFTPRDAKPDWISAGDNGLIVKSLLLNFIQDHPSIPPSAFLEAMDLVRTIFTEGSLEAEAVIRDVDGDIEIILVTSFFLIIRNFYNHNLTAADFNEATDSRYAGFLQSSLWLAALEEFLNLDDDERTDPAGIARARLAMLNDLLPDIQYFQGTHSPIPTPETFTDDIVAPLPADIMIQSPESALSAVYLGPASMLNRSSLDDEDAFYENSEVVEDEDLSLSLTAMAAEVMLLSRLASTASDEIADHGHEDASGRSRSSSPGQSMPVGTSMGTVMPEAPKRASASLYPVPRMPAAASGPLVKVTEPRPPSPFHATAYPSPTMGTPVVRNAASAILPTPFFAPSPLKCRRVTYPLPRIAPVLKTTATPLVESRASMAEEVLPVPPSPTPSFTAPHPISTMNSLAEPTPVRRASATAYPSPEMATPFVRKAASAILPTPFFAPTPLKRRRVTYPLPRIPPPVLNVAVTPLIQSRASMAEEAMPAPPSPTPSFIVPHPLSTMDSLAVILARDPTDWNGQQAEMELLMDNIHAALRYATDREDRDEADDLVFSIESANLSHSEPRHYRGPSVAGDGLSADPHPSVNSIASLAQIDVVSPSPIIPRGVGVPSWVADASQPAANMSQSGSGSPVPQRPSRPTTNSDASTLIGSVSFDIKRKSSYGTASSSAAGSSAELLSAYRRTPFPFLSVLATSSGESDRSSPSSTHLSPNFPPTVAMLAASQSDKAPSKLGAFIRKLRLTGNRSMSEDSVIQPLPPILLQPPFSTGFNLVPVTVPSFPSTPSSQVAPFSPELLMEHEILVPVPIGADVSVAKDKGRWIGKITSPGRWFGRRRSAKQMSTAA